MNRRMRMMAGVLGRVGVIAALMASRGFVGQGTAAEWVNPPLSQGQAPALSPAPAPPVRVSPPETSSQARPAATASRPAVSKKPARPPPSQVATRPSSPEGRPLAAASETSPLVARAADFINAYWNNVAGAEPDVLGYLNSSYGAVVNYYGTTKPKEAVLADKAAYMNRWPVRRTSPVQGAENPKITCEEASSECTISGVREFDTAGPERGARAAGAVRYSYTVRFGNRAPQIISEDSAVVDRR